MAGSNAVVHGAPISLLDLLSKAILASGSLGIR